MESDELIELSGDRLRFRYPVIRAAVYHGASDAGRRHAQDHGPSSSTGCTALPRQTWLRPGTNHGRTGGQGVGTQR